MQPDQRPDTRSCEACNSKRPQGASYGSSNGSAQPQEADGAEDDGFPSLGSAQAPSSSGNPNGKEAKQQKKGKKVSTSSLASLICHHSWNLLALPEHMRIHVVGCWLRAAQIRHTSKYESQISLGCTGQSLQTCIHIKCEGGYTSHLQDATDKSHCLQVSKFERLRLTEETQRQYWLGWTQKGAERLPQTRRMHGPREGLQLVQALAEVSPEGNGQSRASSRTSGKQSRMPGHRSEKTSSQQPCVYMQTEAGKTAAALGLRFKLQMS